MENPYEFYDNKLGVKVKFLTNDTNCNEYSLQLISGRSLRNRMTSNTCTEKQLRKGSFAGDSLVLFSSLSREWKDFLTTKFGTPQKEIKKSWFAQHYETNRTAFDFYVAHRYGDNNENKLDLDLVQKYTFNASMLNTVLILKNNRKAYAKALGGVKIDIWDSLSKDVNAFREVAHDLPATRDGLRYKATKYAKALKTSQQEAFKTIISGRLQNNNAKKVNKDEQLAMLDELISKHQNLDNELIKTVYNSVANQLGWKEITAQTVGNRKTKKNLISHAGRNGVKSLKNNALMQVKRKKPSTPMLYWTLDGWDVELLYQTTRLNDKGHNVATYHNRLTVVVVLDTHNNYPIGYAIGTHETPALITKALQNAMQHGKQMFGDFFMPYQLQSDNYSIKKLRPIYEAITPHFTPAQVGNAKAKVIEPYFNTINKKYCKLLNNWSGFNVSTGSKNQPNSEYIQKTKKSFPDQAGCVKQIESIINTERAAKNSEYQTNWLQTKPEHKQIMPLESYYLTFGSKTGKTNQLRGEGLKITIEGEKHWFDSFDINFRHQAHQDWEILYDTNDLSQVLAVSADGSERFMLESKYIQPMAIADRVEGDTDKLKQINDFNKNVIDMIVDERANNHLLIEPLLEDPRLNDTMVKHLLTDSQGQHKNHKSSQRLQAAKSAEKLVIKQVKKEEKATAKSFAEERAAYNASKININDLLNI